MRKISLWAKYHRPEAILYIIAIKIVLAIIAFFIGSSLFKIGIYIPFDVCIIAIIVLFASLLLYPSRKISRLSKKQFYLRQKSCDLTMAVCTLIMIGTLVNTNSTLPHSTSLIASNSVTGNPPTAEEILSSLQYRDKASLTKNEKKILKQEFKKQLKILVKAKIVGKKDKAEKALLVILTIIAAAGLLYLLAALSCSIACSGSEGLAIAIALLGTAAIIWATASVIKRITRGGREKKQHFR